MVMSTTVPSDEWENVRASTWVNGSKKSMSMEYCCSAVVSGGQAVFYLTDSGDAQGLAVFTNVYKESANFWIEDATNQYQFANYVVSQDKKSLSVDINKLGTVVLGIVNFVTAANGVRVYLRIRGDNQN